MENFGMSPELGRKSICNLECSDVLDPSYDKSSSKNIERSIIPGLHKVYPIPSKVYKTKKKIAIKGNPYDKSMQRRSTRATSLTLVKVSPKEIFFS